MQDPIPRRFGYGQLCPLYLYIYIYLYARSDFPPHPIRFRSSKERLHHNYCTEPARIRSGRPGQILAKRIWSGSKPVCKNHRARFWQNATDQFPTFRLGCVFPQTAWIVLCKTSEDTIGFWLTVSGFGRTDLARKQTGVQESPGPLLASASVPIRSTPGCLRKSKEVHCEEGANCT